MKNRCIFIFVLLVVILADHLAPWCVFWHTDGVSFDMHPDKQFGGRKWVFFPSFFVQLFHACGLVEWKTKFISEYSIVNVRSLEHILQRAQTLDQHGPPTTRPHRVKRETELELCVAKFLFKQSNLLSGFTEWNYFMN